MEILIALTILMVGLMGIMAIFPLGVHYTRLIGEETHGSVISENVIQAVELGLHKLKGYTKDGMPFIIFMGPGVDESGFPKKFDPSKVDKSAECYVEFPTKDELYMYPRNNGDPVAPEAFKNLKSGLHGQLMVTETWPIGEEIKKILDAGRSEYSYKRDYDGMSRDPWPRYSYAFTLVRARIDTDGDGEITESGDQPSDHLFEIAVYVYRNFPDEESKALQEWGKASGRPSKRMKPVIGKPLRTLITF